MRKLIFAATAAVALAVLGAVSVEELAADQPRDNRCNQLQNKLESICNRLDALDNHVAALEHALSNQDKKSPARTNLLHQLKKAKVDRLQLCDEQAQLQKEAYSSRCRLMKTCGDCRGKMPLAPAQPAGKG